MPARTNSLRTLLRTSSVRVPAIVSSTTHAQLTTRALHQQPQHTHRSPSPPPSLSALQRQNAALSVSTTHWTHVATPYSLSSIRHFHATTRRHNTPPTSPQAAQNIEEVIEEIQELYGTARDEFEIAAEETEKNTTYAPDDRAAAREELDKLLEYYGGIVEGGDRAVAEEVKRRVGQRIRELEQAVLALEESAAHGD